MEDKKISCIQCEKPFVFTVAEQQRFLRLGFDAPKRCPDCRKRKSRMIGVNERWKDRNNRRPAWHRSNDAAYLMGKSR